MTVHLADLRTTVVSWTKLWLLFYRLFDIVSTDGLIVRKKYDDSSIARRSDSAVQSRSSSFITTEGKLAQRELTAAWPRVR